MADNNTEKQRVQELTDKLEQGLQELFNSDSYRNYLATMSKFHNYSFNNTLLIAMQKPDATLVAGYKAWQKNFERHVNKGEKAIRILAPAPYKIKEERDKIDPVTQIFHGHDTENRFGADYRDRGTITGIAKGQGSITGTDKGKYSSDTEFRSFRVQPA